MFLQMRTYAWRTVFVLSLCCAFAGPSCLHAQAADADQKNKDLFAGEDLPDSPGTLLGAAEEAAGRGQPIAPAKAEYAPKYHRIVPADKKAQPLSSQDKMVLSLVGPATPMSMGSSLFSASINYWKNSDPHYGTNLPAFGERFGAAKLKQASESILSYGIYASLFHDDPRYYVMGRGEKVQKRVIYSATRVIITRKDDGSRAVNWSKLAGIASASALTNAYYPPPDRRVGRTVVSSVSSIATSAGINELHEFMGDAMRLVFHKHHD